MEIRLKDYEDRHGVIHDPLFRKAFAFAYFQGISDYLTNREIDDREIEKLAKKEG